MGCALLSKRGPTTSAKEFERQLAAARQLLKSFPAHSSGARGTRAALTGAQRRPSSPAGRRGGRARTEQAGRRRARRSHCKVWGRNCVQKVWYVRAYAEKGGQKRTVGKVEGKQHGTGQQAACLLCHLTPHRGCPPAPPHLAACQAVREGSPAPCPRDGRGRHRPSNATRHTATKTPTHFPDHDVLREGIFQGKALGGPVLPSQWPHREHRARVPSQTPHL